MTDTARAGPAELRVTFVCTANICRSPFAAGLAKLHAAQRDAPVRIASAGLLAGGRPTDDHVCDLLADKGVDMSAKLSRRLDADVVDASHLLLTMTTEHCRRVLGEFPTSQPKLYTLRHFLNLAWVRPDDTPVANWLDDIHRSHRRNYATDQPEIEIDDPIGKPRETFRMLGVELDQYVDWLIMLLGY